MPVVKFASATVMTTLLPSSLAVRSIVVPVIFKPAGPDASKPTCTSDAPERAAFPADVALRMTSETDASPRRLSDMIAPRSAGITFTGLLQQETIV
jgi:hypothetical protein